MAKASSARKKREPQAPDLAKLEGMGIANEIDKLVHEKIRLGIMTVLCANKEMSFADLRDVLGTTDGNLAIHARKLEDAGLVRYSKTFVNRFPKTLYHITPKGRRAMKAYVSHMEAILKMLKKGT